MLGLPRKIIEKIENSPTSFSFWLSSFLAIIALRILIENWLEGFRNRSGLFIFYEFTHTFLFFIIAYLSFAWMLKNFLKIEIKKISNVLLWGYLIIISPPIIDYLISHGKGYWSFYDFGSLKNLFSWFFTFFDKTPEMGITYGVRIEIFISLLLIFIYSLIKLENFKIGNWKFIENFLPASARLWQAGKLKIENFKAEGLLKAVFKSLIVTLSAYFIFYILGTFPSWITILVKGFNKGFFKVTDIDTAQMFLAPAKIFSREIPDIISSLNIKMSLIYVLLLVGLVLAGLFFSFRKKFITFVKNFRFPQLIYHSGLLFVGMGLAIVFTKVYVEINFFNTVSFLVLLISVAAAWLTSIIINDIQDRKTDEITNRNRPLINGIFPPREYAILGSILFAVSILFSAIVSFKIALLLAVYQALAWIYSSWPFRLKRFAFLSTLVSAIASLMILFSGFILISPDQNIESLPFPIIFLLIIGYTLSLPVKDFKDIEGDKKEGVYTIPVIFGEQWGKIIIGGGIFLSFILSVLLLNEFRLFWWALIFGAISFWIVNSKNIKPANLPWWILVTVFIYGLALVKIAFI